MNAFFSYIKALKPQQKAFIPFVLLMVIAAVFAWYDRKPTSTQFTAAPPIKSVAKVEAEPVKVANGTVRVLPKVKVGKKVTLPPHVLTNPDVEVSGTAEAEPSETGTEIITTINTQTGDTEIYTKPKETPLFAFENKKRIGVGYGVGTDGPTSKVFGEWSFARVGNFHLSAQAEVSQKELKGPEAKAFAVIDYRF